MSLRASFPKASALTRSTTRSVSKSALLSLYRGTGPCLSARHRPETRSVLRRLTRSSRCTKLSTNISRSPLSNVATLDQIVFGHDRNGRPEVVPLPDTAG
jgi:hypothetical protein